jgi:hypothetical protein
MLRGFLKKDLNLEGIERCVRNMSVVGRKVL